MSNDITYKKELKRRPKFLIIYHKYIPQPITNNKGRR